ncbi:MAG: hypothetical protein ACRDIB_12660 [Ardenticatenaceae bacterium]
MSLRGIGGILGAGAIAFLLLFVMTSLASLVTLLIAWVLANLTALTLYQAALAVGATTVVFVLAAQRDVELLIFGILVIPLATLVFAVVAWLMTLVTALSYLEATIIATTLGVAMLYAFTKGVIAMPLEPNDLSSDDEWESEEEMVEGPLDLDDVVIIPPLGRGMRGRRWVVSRGEEDDDRPRRPRRKKKR